MKNERLADGCKNLMEHIQKMNRPAKGEEAKTMKNKTHNCVFNRQGKCIECIQERIEQKRQHTPEMTAKYLPGEKGGFRVFTNTLDRIKSLTVTGTINARSLALILDSKNVAEDTKAFIVRAVNAHEGLLNTLTWLQNEIDENGQGNLPDGLVSAVRKSIAKAEGK